MNTPRCQGVQILIEELKLKYKFACLVEYCNIPVLLDNNSDAINGKATPFAVMESAAIMFVSA
ncbi:hypothetical protein PtB15_2B284 [Puccinia triticina]|nr:hypothetical protein PtB15_2B284 [Puccinia triticina]